MLPASWGREGARSPVLFVGGKQVKWLWNMSNKWSFFSPQEIRKGNLVCQSRTQKTSWSTALILNTLSRVTELKEITESFSCEFWHDSQQTFPHLNSQKRWIIKGRVYGRTQSLPGCPRRGGQSQRFPRTTVTLHPSCSWVLFQPKSQLFPVDPCVAPVPLSSVLSKPTQPF